MTGERWFEVCVSGLRRQGVRVVAWQTRTRLWAKYSIGDRRRKVWVARGRSSILTGAR